MIARAAERKASSSSSSSSSSAAARSFGARRRFPPLSPAEDEKNELLLNGAAGFSGYRCFVGWTALLLTTAVFFVLGVAAGALLAGQAVIAAAADEPPAVQEPLTTANNALTVKAALPLLLHNRSLAPTRFSFESVRYYFDSVQAEAECLWEDQKRGEKKRGERKSSAASAAAAAAAESFSRAGAPAAPASSIVINLKKLTLVEFETFLKSTAVEPAEGNSLPFWPLSLSYDDLPLASGGDDSQRPLMAVRGGHHDGQQQPRQRSSTAAPPRVLADAAVSIGEVRLSSKAMTVAWLPLALEDAAISPDVAEMLQKSCAATGFVRVNALLMQPRSRLLALTPWPLPGAQDVALTASWKLPCGA